MHLGTDRPTDRLFVYTVLWINVRKNATATAVYRLVIDCSDLAIAKRINKTLNFSCCCQPTHCKLGRKGWTYRLIWIIIKWASRMPVEWRVARQCSLKCASPFLYERETVEKISSTLELSPVTSPKIQRVQPRTTVHIKYACRPDARCPVQMSSFCCKIHPIDNYYSFRLVRTVATCPQLLLLIRFHAISNFGTCNFLPCLGNIFSECVMVTIAVHYAPT